MRGHRWLPPLLLLALGCDESLGNLVDDPAPRSVVELSTFLVTLDGDGGLGSEAAPLPAGIETTRIYVSAQALFSDGAPFSGFSRPVRVFVQPGEIVPGIVGEATFVDGQIDRVPVDVNFAFGTTQVWVEDVLGNGASYVTGVSQEPVHFEKARVRSVQECDRESGGTCRGNSPDFFRSPLEGRFVRMYRHHAGQGDLVVTGVTNEGFFVTDTSEPNDYEFGNLYVYNHNRPEGLRRGQRLNSVAGNVSEFFGLTELGFPSWERLPCKEQQVEGVGYRLCRGTADPSAPDDPEEYSEGGSAASVCPVGGRCCAHDRALVDLDPPECSGSPPNQVCTIAECLPFDCPEQACGPDEVCRNDRCIANPNLFPPVLLEEARVKEHWEMEKLEGGLVRAERVKVLKVGSDFRDYGQWSVQFPDGATRITVVSEGAVPGFHADEEEGACLNIQGSLRFHSVPRWIVYPRDSRDLERTTGCP